jgi:hypothetical protein
MLDRCEMVEQLQALRRRDEHADLAVGQDVGDLPALQQRIDRDEHAAGRRGGEHRDHVLDALLQVHRDAVAPPQPEPVQPGGCRGHVAPELGVGHGRLAVGQRGAIGPPDGGLGHEVMEVHAHQCCHQGWKTSSL